MGVEPWPTGGPVVSRASDAARPRRTVDGATGEYFATAPASGGAARPRRNGSAPADTNALPTRAGRPAASARHRVSRVGSARRSGGPLGDRRGLTAAGALVLLLVFGGVGALVDRLLGHGLWVLFSVGFVAAVLINSLRIHLEDLVASIVMVPLAYAGIGVVSGLLAELGGGSGLRQQAASVAGVLVFGTPILLLSVVVAALVAAGRARAATVARRRARARAARRYGALPPGARTRRRTSGTRPGR